MSSDFTLPEKARKEIAEGLSHVLADTYTLYLKTHNFHWNVEGPMFNSLHLMFETQYTALALAVDELAERVRALGQYAPGSYSAYADLSKVKEAKGVPGAMEMVKQLADDNLTVSNTIRKVVKTAEEAGDTVTADMLIARQTEHEKTAWMLHATAK
jgi:starvation-inducible DNA-binding protein